MVIPKRENLKLRGSAGRGEIGEASRVRTIRKYCMSFLDDGMRPFNIGNETSILIFFGARNTLIQKCLHHCFTSVIIWRQISVPEERSEEKKDEG